MMMRRKKRSFFEKLTGTVHVDDFDDELDEEMDSLPQHDHQERRSLSISSEDDDELDGHEEELLEEDSDGQLTVDVLNTPDEIIIRTMVAGVRPSDLDIDITRDMITIRGERQEADEVADEDYYHRELYWGSFSRNILLPEEVDVDAAEALEKHGLLTIKLPKLDKNRKAKLHVKTR